MENNEDKLILDQQILAHLRSFAPHVADPLKGEDTADGLSLLADIERSTGLALTVVALTPKEIADALKDTGLALPGDEK